MISNKLLTVAASLCVMMPAWTFAQTIPNSAIYNPNPTGVPNASAPTYGAVIINPTGSGGSPCVVGTLGCTGLPIGNGGAALTGKFMSNPDFNNTGLIDETGLTGGTPPYSLQLNYGQATTLLQTSGGGSGFQLTIEASFDNGANWTPIFGLPLVGGPPTTTISYSASTQGFLVNTSGFTNLGLFLTPVVTIGTIAVSSNQSSTPSFVNIASASIGSGAVASGAFTPGSIALGAEVDIGTGPSPNPYSVNARLASLAANLGMAPMQTTGGTVGLVAGSARFGNSPPRAAASGGANALCSLSLWSQSVTTSCASGAHLAYKYFFDNSQNNTEEFVQSYNAASGASIGASVRSCWGVSAGAGLVIPDPVGDAYSSAMSFSVSTTCSGNSNPTQAVGVTVLGS